MEVNRDNYNTMDGMSPSTRDDGGERKWNKEKNRKEKKKTETRDSKCREEQILEKTSTVGPHVEFRNSGSTSDLGLGRGTALRFMAPIDRDAVQWGLGAIGGLASPEGKREKVVIRFLLLPSCVLAIWKIVVGGTQNLVSTYGSFQAI